MRLKDLIRVFIIFLIAILYPFPSHAYVGDPMTFLIMVEDLMPIIAIESFVFCSLFGFSVWHSAVVMFIANGFSALIGIPSTWFIIVYGIEILEEKCLGVMWQAPYGKASVGFLVFLHAALFGFLGPGGIR